MEVGLRRSCYGRFASTGLRSQCRILSGLNSRRRERSDRFADPDRPRCDDRKTRRRKSRLLSTAEGCSGRGPETAAAGTGSGSGFGRRGLASRRAAKPNARSTVAATHRKTAAEQRERRRPRSLTSLIIRLADRRVPGWGLIVSAGPLGSRSPWTQSDRRQSNPALVSMTRPRHRR